MSNTSEAKKKRQQSNSKKNANIKDQYLQDSSLIISKFDLQATRNNGIEINKSKTEFQTEVYLGEDKIFK